jgi:hypothetical protein
LSQSTLLVARIYRLLLSLYPIEFRNEFAGEMQEVFSQAIEEQTKEGIAKFLAFCMRELIDLPGSVYKQHWAEIRKEGSGMTGVAEINEKKQYSPIAIDHHPGSWGEAFLSGLPHLLMGLLIGVGKLLTTSPTTQLTQSVSVVLGLSLGLLVVIVMIYAWRRKWPLWSASWYGYSIFILMGIVTYIISKIDINESWRYTNAVFLSWLAIWGIGYLYLFFRDRLRALLTIFFFIPLLGVMMLEFIPDPIEGWLGISLGLLTALTAATIVRLGSYRVTLGLVIGVNVVAALILAYIGEYKILDLPPGVPSHMPRFENFLELLILYSIVALILMGTPFLIKGLIDFGRRKLFS